MQCANPNCQAEALYLRSGSVYCIDREGSAATGDEQAIPGSGQKQMIWLCRDCSLQCVVETWRKPGHQLRWRRPQTVKAMPFPEVQPGRRVAA